LSFNCCAGLACGGGDGGGGGIAEPSKEFAKSKFDDLGRSIGLKPSTGGAIVGYVEAAGSPLVLFGSLLVYVPVVPFTSLVLVLLARVKFGSDDGMRLRIIS